MDERNNCKCVDCMTPEELYISLKAMKAFVGAIIKKYGPLLISDTEIIEGQHQKFDIIPMGDGVEEYKISEDTDDTNEHFDGFLN